MAYKTEIQIGVKGTKQLDELRSKIDRLSTDIDRVNSREVFGSKTAASINTYNRALEDAQENLNKTRIRTDSAGKAIGNYAAAINQFVTALGKANGAQDLTNKLIDEEIAKRTKATAELQAYNAAAAAARPPGGSMSQRYLRPGAPIATTQYDQPIGPAPASPIDALLGQSSPVEGRLKRIKEAQDSLIDATRQMQAVEQRMTQQELANDEKVFNAKLEDLKRLHAEELKQIKATDAEELKSFDRRLKAREAKAQRGRKASEAKTKRLQDIGLGAGFPALFGGGAGQVIGGAVGGAVGGFAGSIVGSAVVQQIEDATKRVAELGNALEQLNTDALRDSFLLVNAELEQTVNHLIRAGNAQAAFEVASREAALQTGLLPEATQDITNNVNVLSNVWDETVGTVSSLLAILGAPFVSALAGVLKLINLVAKGLNTIFSLTGSLLKRITEGIANSLGLQRVLQAIEHIMKATNEEEEKGLAASIKRGEQLESELRKNQQLFEFEKKRTLGRTAAEKEINAEIDRAKALKTVDLELEKQIKDKREEFGAAVSHAAQVERDYQIILLEKAAELEKSKINQNHLLTQQNIELEKIKEKYVDLKNELSAREETLKAETKIFNIQQNSLEGIIALERSRNEVASARLDLEESRLGRQLDQLNSVNGSHIIRGQIIDQIAQKQIRQARIEHQNNIISIDQNVAKAELARKQVDFEVKSIQLQVESLRLEAQSIKDLGLRESALKRIYAQEQSTLDIAREMISAADEQLATTRRIAENQKLAAGYALQGKIEAIEATAAEQKRAAFIEKAAAAARDLAISTAAAEASASMSTSTATATPKKTGKTTVVREDEGYKKGKLGATRTSTITTSMPIDPDIKERVQSRGNFKSVEEMVGALEKAQRARNRQNAVQERRSASSSTTASAMKRYSPSGGSQGSSSVNPTVNVTTGPVMNMDGQNYVSQDDFVAGLQSASTQGAEMALKMITSSGGARRDLGVG